MINECKLPSLKAEIYFLLEKVKLCLGRLDQLVLKRVMDLEKCSRLQT